VRTLFPRATHPLQAHSEMGEHATYEYERIARRARIREIVFGAQDGLLSTLALVTGVRGADASRYTVLVAGLAGALAGTISMALGAYIAGKSQRDVFAYELEIERQQVMERPKVELVELVEIFQNEGLSYDAARRASEAIAENPVVMLKTMAEKELGIPYDQPGSPVNDALVMGVSFMLGAAVPIVPYFLPEKAPVVLLSVGLTLAVLFGMGVAKAKLTESSWWRSGLEIAGLAGAAAVLAWGVGQLLPAVLGVQAPAGL
jgi:VIT1/CCC1 family predicted Fe2+/Mn2+ transporter